ncbi:hypothetical protein ACT3TZ_08220 [Brachybacterium sp. AOP25-B2-12]|uniref:hypothetical protein n=1 Tax=Brachybacterium sp. AOP25-B2-12 TaxID=3457710 RepID=UPI0040335B33
MTAEATGWSEGTRVPSLVFGPVRSAVIATLAAVLVFGVVLEALVVTSFIGQKLWRSAALFRELVFTTPLVLWVLVVGTVVALALRVITAWLQVDQHGVGIRGLFRRDVHIPWERIARVVAVRDVARGKAEAIDPGGETYDGLYVVRSDGGRSVAVTGRVFGGRAQRAMLARAHEAGVPVEEIDEITPRELRARVPRAVHPVELHPGLLLLLIALVYIGHTVLTLVIWGL